MIAMRANGVSGWPAGFNEISTRGVFIRELHKEVECAWLRGSYPFRVAHVGKLTDSALCVKYINPIFYLGGFLLILLGILYSVFCHHDDSGSAENVRATAAEAAAYQMGYHDGDGFARAWGKETPNETEFERGLDGNSYNRTAPDGHKMEGHEYYRYRDGFRDGYATAHEYLMRNDVTIPDDR